MAEDPEEIIHGLSRRAWRELGVRHPGEPVKPSHHRRHPLNLSPEEQREVNRRELGLNAKPHEYPKPKPKPRPRLEP